jgi:hypothetical protein
MFLARVYGGGLGFIPRSAIYPVSPAGASAILPGFNMPLELGIALALRHERRDADTN